MNQVRNAGSLSIECQPLGWCADERPSGARGLTSRPYERRVRPAHGDAELVGQDQVGGARVIVDGHMQEVPGHGR
jgi:hypothetical protein